MSNVRRLVLAKLTEVSRYYEAAESYYDLPDDDYNPLFDPLNLQCFIEVMAPIIIEANDENLRNVMGRLIESMHVLDEKESQVEELYVEDQRRLAWEARAWVYPTFIGEYLDPPRTPVQVNLALERLGLQKNTGHGWEITDIGQVYGEQAETSSDQRAYIRWNKNVRTLLEKPDAFPERLYLAGEIGGFLDGKPSAIRVNQLLSLEGLQEPIGKNGWVLTEKGEPYGVQKGRATDPQPQIRWRLFVCDRLKKYLTSTHGQ